MKLVNIDSNTENYKKALLESLKKVSKSVKDGQIETFVSCYLEQDGTVRVCKYSETARKDMLLLKCLGLTALLKDYLAEDFNG